MAKNLDFLVSTKARRYRFPGWLLIAVPLPNRASCVICLIERVYYGDKKRDLLDNAHT